MAATVDAHRLCVGVNNTYILVYMICCALLQSKFVSLAGSVLMIANGVC